MSLDHLRAVSRLAVARRADLDESDLQVFVEELLDLPSEIVTVACRTLARQSRQEYAPAFPTVGDIRDECARVQEEQLRLSQTQLRALAPPPSREPTFHCLDCHDEPNGWRVMSCLGSASLRAEEYTAIGVTQVLHCGREKDHVPHTWTRRCACAAFNPVIAQHRERQREYVRVRQSKSGKRGAE